MKSSSHGFTLIELLVVIAIIGILSSVVLGSLSSARSKADEGGAKVEFNQIRLALEEYYTEMGAYPACPGSSEFCCIGSNCIWEGNVVNEPLEGISIGKNPENMGGLAAALYGADYSDHPTITGTDGLEYRGHMYLDCGLSYQQENNNLCPQNTSQIIKVSKVKISSLPVGSYTESDYVGGGDPGITDQDYDGWYTPDDCNDNDSSIYPGAYDHIGNGIDEDCNGRDATQYDNDITYPYYTSDSNASSYYEYGDGWNGIGYYGYGLPVPYLYPAGSGGIGSCVSVVVAGGYHNGYYTDSYCDDYNT